RKGRGEKTITHRPVPIPEALAKRLAGRNGTLLLRPNGESWAKTNLAPRFDEAIKGLKLSPTPVGAKVTLYALRHTSIMRQIRATKYGVVTHTCISVAQPPRPKTENKVIALHRRKPVPG